MTPLTSTSHTETVKALYAAFGSQDMAGLLATVDENVDWNNTGVASRECPWNGDFSGHAKLPGFFATLGEHIDMTRFEPREFTQGENHVAVLLRIEFTIKKNGQKVANDAIHFWTFGPSGKIVRYRQFNDTAQELAAWRA